MTMEACEALYKSDFSRLASSYEAIREVARRTREWRMFYYLPYLPAASIPAFREHGGWPTATTIQCMIKPVNAGSDNP